MKIQQRNPVPLVARVIRAALLLACVGIPAAPLLGQRVPVAPEQASGTAAQEALPTFLADFSRGWCAGEDLQPCFDLSRCRVEIWRGLRELDPQRLPPVVDFPEALGRSLSAELRGRRARSELLGIQLGTDPHEATAYLRFVDADGGAGDLRLCLTRSGSSWRVWDLEELAAGIGLVDTEVIVGSEPWQDPVRRREFLLWIGQLQRASLGEHYYQRDRLPQLLRHRARFPAVPARIEAFWQVCEAVIARNGRKHREAIRLLQLAAEIRGDRPLQARVLAEAFFGERCYDEAVDAIDRWQLMVGVELESEYLRGRVREEEGSRERALAAYRRCLELEEHHLASLGGLARLLPAGEEEEIVRALRSSPDPFRTFLELREYVSAKSRPRLTRLLVDMDGSYLERILQYVQRFTDPSDSSEWGSLVFTLLHPCLSELTSSVEEERWRDLYVKAAFGAERFEEAYEALSRPDETFETLARIWIGWWGPLHEASWPALLDRRERDDPEDPLLWVCRGCLLLSVREGEAAELLFTRADEAGVSALPGRFTEFRVENLYQLGRAREALEKIEPREVVFEILLGKGLFENDAPLLRLLAEFRKSRDPLDPEPTLWLAHAEFLDAHYQECLRLLALGETSPAAWEKGDSVYVDDRFRSLLRLHRLDEALAVAVSWSADDGSDWYEQVAHGARGEHDKVLKVLEEYLEYWPEAVWADPDFGPIFAAAPEYAALREKYPRE